MKLPGMIAAALAIAASWPAGAAEIERPLIAQACAGCHGQDGAGQGDVAAIAGYDRDAFIQVWGEFRADARPATIMGRIARGYTDAEVATLADYFSALK